MEKQEIIRIREKQRLFYASGRTLDVNYRLSALRTLRAAIRRHEADICAALTEDLGKSAYEGFMTEIGMVYGELRYMIRQLPRLAAGRRVRTPITQFPAASYEKPAPLGTVLIMSPWNYPFLLTMDPLVDALAAGNTALVKPSAYAPATSRVIGEILGEVFPERYVAVVTGGRAENGYLLDEAFDAIFFTGSKTVGRLVMRKAAEHLCPVILELGGKSPCIVTASADIPLAARRIVWGKFLNAGQTCVAPDYIYCDVRVADRLTDAIVDEILRQYGHAPLDNPSYGRIINQKHYERILGLIDEKKTVFGGTGDPDSLRIEPTVLRNVTWADAVMGEEIFGPLLPILTYRGIEEAICAVNRHPKPLALYVFSESRETAGHVLRNCCFGGGCINDTIVHLDSTALGFGGVGESGMGSYHGRYGFEAFSHRKSLVDKRTWLDLPMRYQPYRKVYGALLKRLMR